MSPRVAIVAQLLAGRGPEIRHLSQDVRLELLMDAFVLADEILELDADLPPGKDRKSE